MFHCIGRDRKEWTTDPSFTGYLATSNGINGQSATVGRILYGESQFQVLWHLSETPPFHPEETDLVVILPRDIVRRTDVNVLWFQRDTELGLNRLCFGDPFIPLLSFSQTRLWRGRIERRAYNGNPQASVRHYI
jgi:hypothetical protein